ncbi:MAG: hypothetical protein AAGF97_17740, partial [Planctomycetota bacterium]
KDQGWIGAIIVGGMIVFAVTFLRPLRAPKPTPSPSPQPALNDATAETPPAAEPHRSREPSAVAATELMLRVAETYQAAAVYRDRTLMQLVAANDPTRLLDHAEMLVEFQKPNRLRVDIHRDRDQLLIVSDGDRLFARIVDPGTDNFDNQLVVKDAPARLTVQSLYEACEYSRLDQPGEKFSALMSLPAPLLVSQLSLLIEPNAMHDLLRQATEIEQLSEDRFRGLPSHRVRLAGPGGEFIFWIDPATHALQKIQFPSAPPVQAREAGEQPPRLVLTAEFRDRRFEPLPGGSPFEVPMSPATQPVQRFILPPEDDADDLLGRTVRDYWFTDLYGGRVDDRRWRDQVAVMVWFANHPASRAVLHEIQETARRLEQNPRVEFLAVCVEPSTRVSHQQVDQLLKSWSIQLPVARDLEAFGRDVFRVQQAPTLVVVDDQGRVQLIEIGGSAELDQQLGTVLERLLAGENLAQKYLDHQDAQRQKYEQMLSEVRLPRDVLPLPRLSFSGQP